MGGHSAILRGGHSCIVKGGHTIGHMSMFVVLNLLLFKLMVTVRGENSTYVREDNSGRNDHSQ